MIKEETVKLMTTNCLTDKQRKSYWVDGYGYGLGVRYSMGNDNITDFAWGGEAGAYLFIDRENKITAFDAQHVLNSPVQNLRQQIIPIIQEAFK